MTNYAIHNDETELDKCLALAKGSYQRDILLGREALSGATLRGAAQGYASRYKQSSANLIARCQAANLKIREQRGDHNRRELVIG